MPSATVSLTAVDDTSLETGGIHAADLLEAGGIHAAEFFL